MPRCGNGHESATTDYCDVCGVPMSGSSGSAAAGSSAGGSAGSAAGASVAAPPAPAQSCGSCGQPMLAGARFCELCGWDAEAAKLGADPSPPPDPEVTVGSTPSPAPAPDPAPAPGPGLAVVVTADRDYFETVRAMEGPDAAELTFPAYWPERRFPLTGSRIVIGRRSRSRGTNPDIDLGGQFADPGVSHLHAMLVAQPDGSWAVVDLGSSNGTYLNDGTDPIRPNVPVSIEPGDRIHLGAWTTLTIS
ncbi:MAG TPA: FHA domain-containing protein [Natronosporangium sp.]